MYTKTLTLANGVKIPQMGLGTWFIDDANAAEAVRAAVKLGYRHVDTAAGCKRTKTDGSAVLFRSGVDGRNICVYTDCGIINKRMRRLFEGKDESL